MAFQGRKKVQREYYDYSQDGWYFVTICTKNRHPFFGTVINHKMVLSEIGTIAHETWLSIPRHRTCASLDELIVMPDHVHGIIHINHYGIDKQCIHGVPGNGCAHSLGQTNPRSPGQSDIHSLGPTDPLSLRKINTIPPRSTRRQHEYLPVIIGSFKSAVTKIAHRNIDPQFAWQTSYHDHVIPDEQSLHRIRQYIRYNPKKWRK